MNSTSFDSSREGLVASLHLHPLESGEAFSAVDQMELVAGAGIKENPRYFGRTSRRTGKPSRRQVSIIERELIAQQAAALKLPALPPGVVRSNIETTGVNLQSLLGRNVQVGDAILHFYEPRTPCAKMDAICRGLRDLMEEGRQGVMAEVIRSGTVRVGDAIRPA